MAKPQIRLPLGLILAGGAGRRMGGQDKALLPLAGQPLLAHVLGRLAPQVAGVVLSAAAHASRYQALAPDLPVLPDPLPGGLGPLAGLLAGLTYAAAHGHDRVLSVAVDTPFFPATLAQSLLAAGPGCDGRSGAEQVGLAAIRPAAADLSSPAADAPVLAASASGLHPTFGLWPVALAAPLREYLLSGQRRLRDFALTHGAQIVRFGNETEDLFFNINTPDDLILAQKRLPGTETG